MFYYIRTYVYHNLFHSDHKFNQEGRIPKTENLTDRRIDVSPFNKGGKIPFLLLSSSTPLLGTNTSRNICSAPFFLSLGTLFPLLRTAPRPIIHPLVSFHLFISLFRDLPRLAPEIPLFPHYFSHKFSEQNGSESSPIFHARRHLLEQRQQR